MYVRERDQETGSLRDRSTMLLRVVCAALMFFIASSAGSYVTACSQGAQKGRLYLIGVGPGDADNITLRALNTIKGSQVVFCMGETKNKFRDILKGKEIHGTSILVHKTFMGKRGSQDEAMKEVNRISGIIRKAVGEGKTVSILEGGDPTIYGPMMWFMEVFEDLNPEIVPGLSCFNAANAALKKGVTWGEKTRSVILTNGADLEKLAESGNAMVFFTMRINVQEIAKRLKPYYPPETPVAIVIDAGYKEKERIVRGTLDTIQEKTKGEKFPPYLFYVGDFLTKRYGIDCKEGKGDTKK